MNDHWSLPGALDIRGPELVAFVGGGGKTSLMFALAAALPGRVVITTTTRIFAAQMRLAPALAYADDLSPLAEALATHGRCLVVGHVDGDKAHGIDPTLPARLLARPDVNYVLVEADGSRMRPVKAPAEHEPVIPPETTLVVPVAGLDALERPLDGAAHRPERVMAILGDEGLDNGRLTAAGLARLLTDAAGGLKGAPDGARVVPWLNKVETEQRLSWGRAAARLMLRHGRPARVVLGAARTDTPVREVWRRVAAVVLAAGLSRRMGANKLLLPWGTTASGRPQTVLGQTLRNTLAAGVHSVVVVSGHEAERTRAVVAEAVVDAELTAGVTEASVPHTATRAIRAIQNPDYAKGMLSSVQAAVRALPEDIDAILVILGDQPLVRPATLDRLLWAYAAAPAGLVAPAHDGVRGNPVLIDRRYFAELQALPPEAAPRRLLQRHPDDLRLVEVDDPGILQDLDDPETYAQWRP